MKLIDKDALVAEIESLTDNSKYCDAYECGFRDGNNSAIDTLKGKLNTLEVKEVNLEKESELIANGIMIGVQANRYNTVVYNTKRNDFNHSHLMLAARKGIELGLKAKQG